MGILPKEYPDQSLTTEEIKALLEELFTDIIKNQRVVSPRFLESTSSNGGQIFVTCVDEETANWLRAFCQSITNILEIKAVDEKDLPSQYIANAYFPKSGVVETSKIIGPVEAQNKTLIQGSGR